MAKVSIFEKLRGTFGLTDGSYRRLMKFKIAVDRLHQLVPELMPRIIDGNARLSMDNAMAVSKWEPEIIRAALEKLRDRTVNMSHIFNEYPNSGLGVRKYNRVASEHRQTVKDTPAFDPEAQISGICYTIPSWAAAVDRAFTATEFVNVSLTVRHKFVRELTALRDTVQTVLDILKEGD
jgi:hypothetical protein